MKVTIDIGLDVDGNHDFGWRPSRGAGVDVPHGKLQRWAKEREAFVAANQRWKQVVSEIEDTVLREDVSSPAATVVVGARSAKK